jgi:hypothetical protein
MHIFLFFYFFSIFLFLLLFLFFFFFIFLGLGPAQPTWAGLDPARSLAQASDPAGPQHA